MGYIEETGMAQYYRDVRVTAIYEGTNGIQAMDLVARKMADGGTAAKQLLDEIDAHSNGLAGDDDFRDLAAMVRDAASALRSGTEWMAQNDDFNDRFAGAAAYLHAFARVLGAYYHLIASKAEGPDGPRMAMARFYIERMLPEMYASLAEAKAGAGSVFGLDLEGLGG